MAGEIDEVAGLAQYAATAPHDLNADVRQYDLAEPALDQLHTQDLLELADLHRQRRLRDRTGLGSPAKMPMFAQRLQISQLSQGDHIDQIFLLSWLGNTI